MVKAMVDHEMQKNGPKNYEYQDITKESLSQKIRAHEEWIASEKTSGTKIELSFRRFSHQIFDGRGKERLLILREAFFLHCDFSETHFLYVDLSQSNWIDGSFRSARIHGSLLNGVGINNADFSSAHLRESQFKEASLYSAKFHNAEIHDCDFTAATGLQSHQFAGADLSGTKLPGEIGKFLALKNVEEISRNARTLFLGLLAANVYSWLAMATTTDYALFMDNSSITLPVVQSKVPIVGFYFAAPVILLSLFVYLHLYLKNLWEELSELPAIFPDGRSLDKVAYPWMLNGLVNQYFFRLKNTRPYLWHLPVALSYGHL